MQSTIVIEVNNMADIELVIKMPEEIYDYIHNEHVAMRVCDSHKVARAISDGIPLPKGHKRLIEDNFKVGPVFDKEGNRVGYQYVTQEDLNNALTIIEADKGK